MGVISSHLCPTRRYRDLVSNIKGGEAEEAVTIVFQIYLDECIPWSRQVNE